MKIIRIIFIITSVITNILLLPGCSGRVEDDGIDYTITDAVFPGNLQVGNTDTISFTVKNRGNRDSMQGFAVKLYVSDTYYLDESKAYYLNEVADSSSLSAGETWNADIQFTLPPESPFQAYFILKIETTEDDIDGFNNVISSSQLNVTGGTVNRTEILVDNTYHNFNINSYALKYYYFNADAGHAYLVYWDDRYEGMNFFDIGADILVTANSENGSINYFTEIDSGYYNPVSLSVQNTEKVLLDVKSLADSGDFGIKIKDNGIPPDLSITLDSHIFKNPTNTLELTYTVYNQSTVSTNGACFYVGFWLNAPAAPTMNDVADYYVNNCPSIAPGGQLTLTAFIPSSIKSGIAYAYVDVYDNIVELDEGNNVTLQYNW